MSTARALLIAVALAAVSPSLAAQGIPSPPPAPHIVASPGTGNPNDTTERRGEVYYHLMLARLALSQGRAGDVVGAVNEATSLMPDDPALLGEAAMLLAVVGRRSEAEALARKALTIDPDALGAMRVLADLAFARSSTAPGDAGSRAEAIRLYERLSQLEDRPPDEIFAQLSRLKAQAGDFDGAAAAARRFQAARPGDRNSLRLLTQALYEAGHVGEALGVVLDWLDRNPDDEDLVPMALELSRGPRDWARVETTFRKVVEAQPVNHLALALLGEALVRLDRPGDAAPFLERAIKGPHGARWVGVHLAASYLAVGRFADAEALGRTLSRDYPDNALVWAITADATARRGNFEAAIRDYERAIRAITEVGEEAARQRDEIRRRIASIHLAAKHPDRAADLLEGLERPDEPTAVEMKAEVALAEREPARARAHAGALRKAGAVGVAAMIEAEALLQEGRLDSALELFGEAFGALGHAARSQAAASLVDAGHSDDAERILRGWVASAPDDPLARLRLGGFLEGSGRFDAAEVELREALRLDPGFAEALNYLGYSLADRNVRLDEAVELIRQALAIDPANGAYLDSLGWAYFRQGKFREAREPLEKAARELPRDPTVLEHLGDVYERLGESKLAEQAYRNALEADPENPERVRGKLETLRKAENGAR